MRRRSAELAGAFGTPVASIVIECLVCHYDNPSRVRGLGLLTVTPWPVFVLVFALSASFGIALRSRRLNGAGLTAHIAALALLLPGLPGFLEQYPRFDTAWLHVGFVQAMIVHRHPIVGLDARFSWPGFFTGIAAVVGMAHLGSALGLLRWAPLVFNLAYALPVFIIARALVASSARAWSVTWLFILTNWVGQDYFSPQAMAFFIFLGCVALVVVGLHMAQRPVGDRLLRGLISRFGNPFHPDALRATPAQRIGLMLIALLASVALAMEHQLTPVALAVDLIALCLARQTSARYFTLAVVLSLLLWVSYGASAFWEGNIFTRLFGGGGGAQAVQTTVAARIVGSRAHQIVVYERILFTLAVWSVAGIGVLRAAWTRRPVPLAALLMAFVPFLTLAVQSYGGEATLRLYLYTLPFMLILAVEGVAGLFPRRRWATVAMIAVISTLIVPALLVARFGNEQFEQVTPGDYGAVRYVYSVAASRASIWAMAPSGVWGYQGLAKYSYPLVNVPDMATASAKQVLAAIYQNPHGSYLLITPGQIEYAIVNYGAPKDWGAKLEARLARDPNFELLYNRSGGRVYAVVPNV